MKDEARVKAYVSSGLVAVVGAPEPSSETAVPEVDLIAGTLEQLQGAWEVEMTPQEYMEKFPDGPHAELAMRIIELEAETVTGE
jgi:hypothetical protein